MMANLGYDGSPMIDRQPTSSFAFCWTSNLKGKKERPSPSALLASGS